MGRMRSSHADSLQHVRKGGSRPRDQGHPDQRHVARPMRRRVPASASVMRATAASVSFAQLVSRTTWNWTLVPVAAGVGTHRISLFGSGDPSGENDYGVSRSSRCW